MPRLPRPFLPVTVPVPGAATRAGASGDSAKVHETRIHPTPRVESPRTTVEATC